ncbi:probable hexose transporter [Rhynchosporium agropyri]|uniref:Probable hexose transporter n=2 Tax=Rhynchosporium TaxID=38037 RepID=A0A1E1L500_9HELO|nr:probable hexose transporter [Rhynchosporium commune]CZT05473.1 probable hexose transporter [Rhynchosporium agropyri]
MGLLKVPRVHQNEALKPVKPPKGHFFFAGRMFPRIKWWKDTNLRTLYIYIVVLILTNTANGFDGSMMNGLQALDYWVEYFDHPKGSKLGVFNAAMSMGSLIGMFFVPYMIDRWGRKIGVVLGCCIMLLAVGIQTGATNFGMFIAARLILGLGDTIVLGAAPLLIAEISHPQDRAILVTLSGASYHSGAFIASWVTYGTLKIKSDWSWRLPSLLQSVCSIIILVLMYWIPESPRYLINSDQPEKALDVLAHYHASDNREDEFVQLEFTEIKTAITLDKEAEANGWLDLVATKGNRKRIGIITAIGFFSQWSGNGLISYYLAPVMKSMGITNPQTILGINGGMKSWGLFVNIFMSFQVDRLGRRPTYLISTVGTLVAFTIWTIISARYAIEPQKSLGTAFVFMIFVYGTFYDFKSGLLASYTTEILPYGIRAKGFTWLNFCVTAALTFNQYANSVALDALAWKYYIFYCVFLAFEVIIVYLFIIETRYTPLEEINKFFDGDSAIDVAELAIAEVNELKLKDGTMVHEVEKI